MMRRGQPRRIVLADPLPGLSAAEYSAEGAALNAHGIRSLHRDPGVVVPAAVGVMDPADPFRIRRLHVDQDLRAGLLGVAAQILPAWFDANVALVVFGGPDAERRGRGRARRGCGCRRGRILAWRDVKNARRLEKSKNRRALLRCGKLDG